MACKVGARSSGLAARAARHVQQYDYASVVEQYLSLYRTVIAPRT